MTKLRDLAKRSKSIIIAYKIYDNWRITRRFRGGNPESLHGSTHLTRTLDESLDYINAQFEDYLQYGEMTAASLRGKRIFELGFGDNVGVALKFLAVGAAQKIVCLDKFYSKRDEAQQRTIYLALRESLSQDDRSRFDDSIDLKNGIQFNPERLQCIYGVDVENCKELSLVEPFDLIVSRGAIQDIYEPDAALTAMDRMLAKGGSVLHKIDLSDQGIFRDNGLHPLTFLTISEPLYRMMARGSGKPNRKLLNYYRERLEGFGYNVTILITDLIGRKGRGDLSPHRQELDKNDKNTQTALKLLKGIRPRLIPRFRILSADELIVSGIFLIGRKPE